jgi:hypothetical protein
MRKIAFFALFLLTMVVSAQGNDEYQLRHLDIEEYFPAVHYGGGR